MLGRQQHSTQCHRESAHDQLELSQASRPVWVALLPQQRLDTGTRPSTAADATADAAASDVRIPA